jgi:hypothetical protein
MYLSSDDLKALSSTVAKLDGMGGEFNGSVDFEPEAGSNPIKIEYRFDKSSDKHYLNFPDSTQ